MESLSNWVFMATYDIETHQWLATVESLTARLTAKHRSLTVAVRGLEQAMYEMLAKTPRKEPGV